jgi:hypothetical protein
VRRFESITNRVDVPVLSKKNQRIKEPPAPVISKTLKTGDEPAILGFRVGIKMP